MGIAVSTTTEIRNEKKMSGLQAALVSGAVFARDSIHSVFFSVRTMSWTHAFALSLLLSILLILYVVISRSFPNRMSIKGRHVVITGGSSGIGLACAKECARRGARITLIARDPRKLEKAKEEVQKEFLDRDYRSDSDRVIFIPCDVMKG